MAVAGEGSDVKGVSGEGTGAGPDEGSEAENATSSVPATKSDSPDSGNNDVNHTSKPAYTHIEMYQNSASAQSTLHNDRPAMTNMSVTHSVPKDPRMLLRPDRRYSLGD